MSAQAQNSDSTMISPGVPPLPTGIWDSQTAANTLSSQVSNLASNLTVVSNASNAAYSAAAVAAATGSTVVAGNYQAGGPNNDTLVYYGICTSTYNSYLYNYSTQYPTVPGTYVCPSNAPYFYIQHIDDNPNSQGG